MKMDTIFSFIVSKYAKINKGIFSLLFLLLQYSNLFSQDSLSFKHQLSAWTLINTSNELPVYAGGRYIPQLNYDITLKNKAHLDFEASANLNGSFGFNPFDTISGSSQLKPYRLWARYSNEQLEIRAGLQKINFGSASILRPLMWFDQVDPRDPLKMTDGVWGILGRYYFLNNANLWFWTLYGNDKPRGWEFIGTNKSIPEIGGRLQVPLSRGETAFSYNFRKADSRALTGIAAPYSLIPENKLGFDIKMDLVVGCWLEGSWVSKQKDLGMLTNQEIFNVGVDYTFNLGSGLYVILEQLIAANDQVAFKFENTASFSLLSTTYPLGLFSNLSGIVYYDWKSNKSYNFLNLERQFKNVSFYFMGFWNPENYLIPTQGTGQSLFGGKGFQIMFVLNK